MLAQNAFSAMVQFKQAEVEQSDGLRVVVQSLNQQLNDPRQCRSRILIALQPITQLSANAKPPESGFRGCPEQISFPREVTEYRNFANPRQSGDLMRTAGGET